MKTNTLLFQRSISKVLQNSKAQVVAEIIFLLLLGMLAITLHAKLRIPTHMPGKHGLLFMFILMSGRMTSRFGYPAMIGTLGASSLLITNTLGFSDPFLAGIYLLIGFSTDFFLNTFKSINSKIVFIAFVGGFSYMLIPISRLVISSFTGFMYNSLVNGFLFPVFTHFCFGFIGALIAALTIKFLSPKKK